MKQLRTLEREQKVRETQEKRKEHKFKENWADSRQNWWEVQKLRDKEMKKDKGEKFRCLYIQS